MIHDPEPHPRSSLWHRSRVSRYQDKQLWNANEHVHFGWRDVEGVESDIPAELFTKYGLPDVGIDAFVVVRSRVWDLARRERVVLYVVLESELSRTCEHGLLQLLEDFAIKGVYLGEGGRLSWPLLVDQGFGWRL